MHDLAGSYFRGFSNPADRTTWAWIAAVSIAAVILGFLAFLGRDHPRIAASDGMVPELMVVPPISQPAPSPDAGAGRQAGI